MSEVKQEKEFVTGSGLPVKAVYTQEDIADLDPEIELGTPGKPPFTRGVYSGMYRTMPWRIRQLTSFGTVQDMRDRIRYAMSLGDPSATITGDFTTACMFDLDNPEVVSRKSDVGVWGAPIMSLADWEIIFEGVPLDMVYVGAMATPQGQPYDFGCYFALAEKNGVPLNKLNGTGFQDMCTCYLASPIPDQVIPTKALKFVGDTIEFCVENAPHVTSGSFSGYNIRECGINAYQELAIILSCAIEYIDEVLRRGRLKVDDFVHGLAGGHMTCDRDFFEEVAKFRAMRRMWAKMLRERYDAQDPKSLKFRMHCQTSGASLTLQQPLNNIVRVGYQVLAAALGGVQSMNSDCYDEAISVPSAEAALLAIRTQQIAQHEIGITNVIDPLGGSYYIERLTKDIEEQAWDYLKKIEGQGGFIQAVESGWLPREFTQAMLQEEKKVADGRKKIVGVNCFQMEEEPFEVKAFQTGSNVWEKEHARFQEMKGKRDKVKLDQALGEVKRAIETDQNIMRPVIEAVKAYATVGEMGQVWKEMYPTTKQPIASFG